MNRLRRKRVEEAYEKNMPKYLGFAIGEVILVMTGILLALQVNTWNEERQRKGLQKEILLELKQNFHENKKDADLNMRYHMKAHKSSHIIKDLFYDEIHYHDSLHLHFAQMLLDPVYFPTHTAFNRLNQIGTDIITDDSLRNLIIVHYDVTTSYLIYCENDMRKQTHSDVHHLYRKNFEYFSWFGDAIPYDINTLKSDREFRSFVNYRSSVKLYYFNLYAVLNSDMEMILELIDKELENL
jgi:hypothetical protein